MSMYHNTFRYASRGYNNTARVIGREALVLSALAEHLARSLQAWASSHLVASYLLHRLLSCLPKVGTPSRHL